MISKNLSQQLLLLLVAALLPVAGGIRKNQTATRSATETQGATSQSQDTYNRAYATCLESRG